MMDLCEKDIRLEIEGMGIVMYSPKNMENIPEGYDYLKNEYSLPNQVAEHLRQGDVIGFCTGSGGCYNLKIRSGYPSTEIEKGNPVSIRLGIEVKDEQICFIDLFWLMEWYNECPPEQCVELPNGYYHVTVLTKKPKSRGG
ncbi:MAG: hypothetical protein Q4F28_01410 [Eubacteriales bacterium]|nr:hypothetical protein [Eubacteriales bacterium]